MLECSPLMVGKQPFPFGKKSMFRGELFVSGSLGLRLFYVFCLWCGNG